MLGTRVTRSLTALATTVATAVVLTACDPLAVASRDGLIDEVERGRNGTKVEVVNADAPDGHDEFYLLVDSPCRKDQRLRECADVDDFLKPVPGATPGLNPTTPR